MSPRTRPRGPWADSGRLEWLDLEGEPDDAGTPICRFTEMPCGTNEVTNVEVWLTVDALNRVQIKGMIWSKPMNARRLKAFPLDALRRECERLLRAETDRMGDIALQALGQHLGINLSGPALTEADRLRRHAVADRTSDEFMALVAATCKEAREGGQSAWRAVSEALGVQQAQAQRYIARAREAGYDVGVLRRTTDDLAPIKSQPQSGTTSPRKRG